MIGRRRSLWLLLVPFVVFLVALPFVNHIHPLIFGVPFFTIWMLVGVVCTPVAVWLAARYDPLYGGSPSNETAERERSE